MRAIEKYLQRYAEPECSALHNFPDHLQYHHCVIIPAYDESPEFIERLTTAKTGAKSLLQNNVALAVIVINQPDSVAQSDANRTLEDHLHNAFPTLWQQDNLTLFGESDWGILMVERYRSQPIPRKQGVGLARKIAADLCVKLMDSGAISSRWVHSTDADATLPDNYFSAANDINAAALTYGYRHRQNSSMASTATQLYQTSLEYYVEGLHWANSPYAFHTLGSIIAADCNAYCQVRGFPKRAGGEDFYLLNKLAKLGNIKTPDSVIELEPRVSHRVPFGTGPAVEKILSAQQLGQPRADYAPEVFQYLQQTLQIITVALTENRTLESALANIASCSRNALDDLRVSDLKKHLEGKVAEQQIKHFHLWFDGFKTLKFIHYLQRHHFPAAPLMTPPKELFQCLQKLPAGLQ